MARKQSDYLAGLLAEDGPSPAPDSPALPLGADRLRRGTSRGDEPAGP